MFKKIYEKSFIKILQILLLLVLTTTICYGLDLLASNATSSTINYESNATSISSQDLHPHILNANITILHEVHDGSYSTKKKDRADILPLKPIKKKHYALLDKIITPITYEKSKPLKEVDLHPVVFDYNLGDLEDLEHESFKKGDLSTEEKALLRNTNTTESILHYKANNNNKDDESEEHALEDDLNVQVDIVTTTKGSNSLLLSVTNSTMISPTASTSLSSSTSVVTISPHIFKVSKTKSTKKGRELLKREDLQKSSNNHNSINRYFNEYSSLGSNASMASLQSANVFQIFINLYDHFYWQAADIRKKVSTGCGLELQAYLTALHGNYHWAQQAYDASGRYRGQLFFGNDKWLGQKSFCYELNRQLEPESRKHFEFEFYAALININLRLPKEVTLNLQLGECLPKSCSSQDIQHILDLDPHAQILKSLNYSNISSNNTTSVKILRVRTVPGIYSFWRELNFQIFASFTFTLIVLVIVATWYQCKVNDKHYIEPAISVISQKIDASLAHHMANETRYMSNNSSISNNNHNNRSFELYQMSTLNENNNNNNNNANSSRNNNSNIGDSDMENNANKALYTNGNRNRNLNGDTQSQTTSLNVRNPSTVQDKEYKIETTETNICNDSLQGTYIVKQHLGLHEQLLLCFAFQTNASSILNVDLNKERLLDRGEKVCFGSTNFFPIPIPNPNPIPNPISNPIPISSPISSPITNLIPNPILSTIPSTIPNTIRNTIHNSIPNPISNPIPNLILNPIPNTIPNSIPSPVPNPISNPIANPIPNPISNPITNLISNPIPSTISSTIPNTIRNTIPNSVQTSCVHGLRVISVLWTILVHTYLQIFSIGENRFRRIIVERSPWYQLVGNATFSVDTFFFISGFLVTLLFLKHEKKYPTDMHQYVKKGTTDTFMMLLYRYIRLTPAYLFVIFFNDFSSRETFNDSIFQPTIAPNTCNQYWWRNILYVNNFYPLSEICMIWSWYMANEMQFYIMATILLVASVRYFKTAVLTLTSVLISSWGVAGLVSLKNHYTHKVANPFESFDFLYDKPWQRVGTYIMGMLTGYIIHKVKTPPKISGRINFLLWFLSLGLLALIIFGVWEGQLSEISTAFYVSIGHTAFGLSLVWIVLSCCWGLTPTFNRLLSYRCLWPLSRLTYCAYLIHPVIMLITAFRMDGTVQLNNVLIVIVFFGNAVISFIAAFFISVLLEAPVVRLLKILLRK
uniref:Nose resistant-to-fluoxetine protein N-terminal domain-containing protein n=1 Tax=Glossina brevipalpis TaxID=37001 RepID=A0A1A9W274_9MUSC